MLRTFQKWFVQKMIDHQYRENSANIGEIHYHKGKQNKWSKQIEFSAESNQFEKKKKCVFKLLSDESLC